MDMQTVLVLAVCWVLSGLVMIIQEYDKGNKKVLDMNFFVGLKVLLGAIVLGPFTRRMVICKL